MNFFKIIFGNPFGNDQNGRLGDEFPNNFPQSKWEVHNDYENEENNLSHSDFGFGMFNFPLFKNLSEIEKDFDNMQNEMEKIIKIFGFNTSSDMQWTDENNENKLKGFFNSLEESKSNDPASLRDSCFKTPEVTKKLKIEDTDLDGKVTADQIVNYLDKVPETHKPFSSIIQYSSPKIYSKSVFIREIKRPDGSIETIKKIVDHTGKEETTITQNQIYNHESLENKIVPKENSAGISLLKKFFPF